MVTYSHEMTIALIEKAIKEGREAYRNHLADYDNPYTGRYAKWWAQGWKAEAEGK